MPMLEVPGAHLRYKVEGQGPLIVFVAGARGEGDRFLPTTRHLRNHYKVVTYDRRGYAGSVLTGRQDYGVRLDTDASDIVALIQAQGDGPAVVFGSSSGAIVALHTFIAHPRRVGLLLAHEPPALTRLPPDEALAHFAADQAMYERYRTAGWMAAIGPFINEVMSASDRHTLAELARTGDPQEAARNFDYWFEHELRQYPRTVFDEAALRAAANRLVFLAGDDSVGLYPRAITLRFAEQTGARLENVPGGHIGYTSFGEQFAAALARILADRA